MRSGLNRRDLLKAIGVPAVAASLPLRFAETEPTFSRMPVEGKDTPKICLGFSGPVGESGMRRMKQIGVDYVLTGGPKIPWSEGDLRARIEQFKLGGLTLCNMMISGFDDVIWGRPVSRATRFVQAPMYFQNFLGMMAPQPLPTGGRGWAVPMDPALRVMHAGDVTEVGRAVAAAFSAGDQLPDGSYLAVCGGLYSWNDFVATLNALGHDLQVRQVPPEVYDGFYPGAHEMREMFLYFTEHTYFGPEHETRIAAANALVPGGFTGFADWARVNMKPS